MDDEGDEETGRGGDVFAERGVELHVVSSNFTGSSAVLAGGSIWCCGATLKDSFFTNLETSLDTVRKSEIYSHVGRGTEPLPSTLLSSVVRIDACYPLQLFHKPLATYVMQRYLAGGWEVVLKCSWVALVTFVLWQCELESS